MMPIMPTSEDVNELIIQGLVSKGYKLAKTYLALKKRKPVIYAWCYRGICNALAPVAMNLMGAALIAAVLLNGKVIHDDNEYTVMRFDLHEEKLSLIMIVRKGRELLLYANVECGCRDKEDDNGSDESIPLYFA